MRNISTLCIACLFASALYSQPVQDQKVADNWENYTHLFDIMEVLEIPYERANVAKTFGEHIKTYVTMQNGNTIRYKFDNARYYTESCEQIRKEKGFILPLFRSQVGARKNTVLFACGPVQRGNLWGYICLDSTSKQLSGVRFDYDNEALGSAMDIKDEPEFLNAFKGASIFKQDGVTFIDISYDNLEKVLWLGDRSIPIPRGSDKLMPGLVALLKQSLEKYEAFLKKEIKNM